MPLASLDIDRNYQAESSKHVPTHVFEEFRQFKLKCKFLQTCDNIQIISRQPAFLFKKSYILPQFILKTRSRNLDLLTAYNGITKPESITIYITVKFSTLWLPVIHLVVWEIRIKK